MTPIATERLTLRRFRDGDAADLLAYLHRPSARCFASMALADIDAAAREVDTRAASDAQIAIEHRADGRLIGDLFAMFEAPDTYSIGWNLNPAFGGNGYAHEAAVALVDHLFADRGARRLYAYVEVDNVPSRRLCARLGMRVEGVFKEFISFVTDAAGAPSYEDTMQYAILRHEWRGGA